MKIETKFSLGDKIYRIYNSKPQTWEPCVVCEGTGQIGVRGKIFDCPECYGHRGKTVWGKENEWMVNTQSMTVGQIEATVSTKPKDNKTQYMTRECGYPSGSFFYEDDLFSSIEDAQEECKQRNKSFK